MVRKWSIYWVNHDPIIGSEQSGVRPALIISNDNVNQILPVVTVLPITSIKEDTRVYPTEIELSKKASGLSKMSTALVHQIRTVSKLRIGEKCGEVIENEMKYVINQAMRDYFEL